MIQCSRDNSKLIWLYRKSFFLDMHYCPVCKILIMEFKKTSLLLEWEIVEKKNLFFSTKMILFNGSPKSDSPSISFCLKFRLIFLKRIALKKIKHFLKDRSNISRASHCPIDGFRITSLQKNTWEKDSSIRFGWCFRCRLGFVFSQDPHYGWKCRGDFQYNGYEKKYCLHKVYGHKLDPELVKQCLLELEESPEKFQSKGEK